LDFLSIWGDFKNDYLIENKLDLKKANLAQILLNIKAIVLL